MHASSITILGSNGHIGQSAADAFAAAGWVTTRFARADRMPVEGTRFVQGDADSALDLRGAVSGADVVFNGLNLPYHQWDKGRIEAQLQRVLDALSPGQTLLHPGSIYNYPANARVVTPELTQDPPTPRGAMRVRMEQMLQQAVRDKGIRVIVLRAGDFFGPDVKGDWFEQGIMREAAKRRFSMPGAPQIGHSWAYLPDLGRAFEKLAWHRGELAPYELFHFAGHYVSNAELAATIKAVAPVPLVQTAFPWALFAAMGLVSPMIREIVKMRYLWQNDMRLADARLTTLLGPDFGTPLADAVAATVRPFFTSAARAAA